MATIDSDHDFEWVERRSALAPLNHYDLFREDAKKNVATRNSQGPFPERDTEIEPWVVIETDPREFSVCERVSHGETEKTVTFKLMKKSIRIAGYSVPAMDVVPYYNEDSEIRYRLEDADIADFVIGSNLMRWEVLQQVLGDLFFSF